MNELWDQLKPDGQGLVTAVVQHARTDQVLMVGHMNAEALAATLERGLVTFWSRSRNRLWQKGETSGNHLTLAELRVDCDGDAVLIRADPAGPTCHTDRTSCFYREVDAADPGTMAQDDGPPPAVDPMLARVFAVILDRQAGRGATAPGGRSYVRDLLAAGTAKITAKLREEAQELADAVAGESEPRVVAETADVIFHAMVALAHRGSELRKVAAEFATRFGTSGIVEKAQRKP